MKTNDRRVWLILAIILLLATGAACSAAAPLATTPTVSMIITQVSGGSLSTTTMIAASATPVASMPGVAISNTPLAGTMSFTNLRNSILAKGLANPDDLFLGPDHALYVSDISKGSVNKLGEDGSVQVVVGGLSVPEGIVSLPGGALIIAEQGKNRLVKFDPATQVLSNFLTLTNTTNQEGVDGLALDASIPARETIIVPDSPNGVLRRASMDGKSTTVIASGFVRPTGAWVEPDGNILVVDETAGFLYRVHPYGTRVQLARFSIPDDVIEDKAGNIYITTLGDHSVHVYTAQGQDIVLLSNISDPQGIAFTSDGNLVVTDPVNHQIIEVFIHSHS